MTISIDRAVPALPHADTAPASLVSLVYSLAAWSVAAQAELTYGPQQCPVELAERLGRAGAALRAAQARLNAGGGEPPAHGQANAYSDHVAPHVWSAASALLAAQAEIGAGADPESVDALGERLTEAADAIAIARSRVAEIRAMGRVEAYADIVRRRRVEAAAKRAATIAAKVQA